MRQIASPISLIRKRADSLAKAISLVGVCIYPATAFPLAFPGAEGFGASSIGGRGGVVIKVTNLNDSGPGSLRAALLATGKRTIVFTVGGTINLASPIIVAPQPATAGVPAVTAEQRSFVTVAGQTAPGEGIQITGWGITFENGVHDVIIRYLKVRPGHTGGINEGTVYKSGILLDGRGGNAGESVAPVYNVIVDHCDLEYGARNNFNTWNYVYNVTLQRTILAYGIKHDDSFGGKGALIGMTATNGLPQYNASGISVHHNLFAHNHQRSPNIRTVGRVEVVNNVIHNWYQFGGQIDNLDGNGSATNQPNQANFVGNHYQNGLDTWSHRYEILINSSQSQSLYVNDNYGLHRPNSTYPQWSIVGDGSVTANPYAEVAAPAALQRTMAFPMSTVAVTTHASSAVFNNVLNNVGANRVNIRTSFRDTFTRRIIDETRNRTGNVISGCGYPTANCAEGTMLTPPPQLPLLATATAPAASDTDNDSLPDAWEISQFRNLTAVATGDADGDGYTNLEEYLNNTPAVCVDVSLTPLGMGTVTLDQGFAYYRPGPYGTPADTGTNPTRSKLQVFENGRVLGPAHALHSDIRAVGQGRYSHWNNGVNEALYFSASNNTNPRTNGRAYAYCK